MPSLITLPGFPIRCIEETFIPPQSLSRRVSAIRVHVQSNYQGFREAAARFALRANAHSSRLSGNSLG